MLDKILWWVSLSCLGLFVNLLFGGLLSWSDRHAGKLADSEDNSDRWMRRGLRVLYVVAFIVSCVLMGLGAKAIAGMVGI